MKICCQLIASDASRMLVFFVNQTNNFCMRFELLSHAKRADLRRTLNPAATNDQIRGKPLAGQLWVPRASKIKTRWITYKAVRTTPLERCTEKRKPVRWNLSFTMTFAEILEILGAVKHDYRFWLIGSVILSYSLLRVCH